MSSDPSQRASETIERRPSTDAPPFRVMLSLGGGGDMAKVCELLDALLSDEALDRAGVLFRPVIGPFAENCELVAQKYSGNDRVSPITAPADLTPYLLDADLYIGAAGGTLYQLMMLGVPAITFALASNQDNDWQNTQDLGHYFLVEPPKGASLEALPRLVSTFIQHRERIEALRLSATLKLDGKGAERVAHVLMRVDEPETSKPRDDQLEDTVDEIQLSEEHSLRKVSDSDINHYLYCRNLDINCNNMIETKKIQPISHYSWWFNTSRESFLLQKSGKPCLYIWHEPRDHGNERVLIGGWFVCDDDTGFQDSLVALSWQLEYCDHHFPEMPWVAVINRQNKFVKLMNYYMGFVEIDDDHPLNGAIVDLFPDAPREDFYYVIRDSVKESGVKYE